MKGIVGTKHGMTQVFDPETGSVTPVTVIQAGPCPVVQVRTTAADGYEAVQLAYEPVAERKLTKGELGHLTKHGTTAHRRLVEFRGAIDGAVEGETVTVEVFEPGDEVKVAGIGIGKGFQGTIKRHNFSSGPGSLSAAEDPEAGLVGGARTARTTSASPARSAPPQRPHACSRASRWPAAWPANASRRPDTRCPTTTS